MKFSLLRSVASGLAATSAIALVLGSMPARADESAGPDADPGVARLSVLRGDVDLKRADSGDTVAAAVNAPVSAGDYVTTRGDSRVEIQYGYGSAVRVAADTQLRFTHLDPDNHALQLAQGTVEMRVLRGLESHPEVDTPAATIRPDERGQYRITVTNDGNTELTVRSGRADVITPNGTQTISPNYTLLIEGQGNDLRFQTLETVAMDGFDQWNAERDGAFEHASDYQYADQGIVGADDLNQYGQWVDNPTYGEVWSPYETAGWSPYQDGRWVWESYYGWTWVGAEAWGYAPYHYGNWFYASNTWFWYPGRANYHRVYSPALVGFFSFGGDGFGFGFGNIGWVPLAPFEAISPWWGRRGFDNRTTVVNINIRNVTINNYRNLAVPNAAVAVTNTNFANGNFKRLIPLHGSDLKTIAAVHGVVPVVPTQH
ncbi:MAG: FecR domain-containing protein, partial [Candidatus Eremiobacteraeota bacterium]|nr:FecR domain-containing protein [Candidatus Eremiobacteraeota bacterium]